MDLNYKHGMIRFFAIALGMLIFVSCEKSDDVQQTVTPIPDIIQGQIREIEVDPADISTPDEGVLVISMNDALYKVQFNVVPQQQANATLWFANDTLLIDESREYGNLGQDIISYNPLKSNEWIFDFINSEKKIEGIFNANTSFGGSFGKDVIAGWRDAAVPTKPTQKAKDDIRNFIRKYMDSNGDEAGITPLYLSVNVSRK